MKVLLVTKLYYPSIGGVEKVVQDIAEGLKDKVELSVLACQAFGLGSCETINGVKVVRAGAITPFWSVPLSFSFPFLFRKYAKEADIIHLHCPFPPGELFYLWLIAAFKKKLVISWHSDVIRQARFFPWYDKIVHSILAKADKIIVATPNHIQSSRYLHYYKNKCVVIPFGIDVDRYKLDGKDQEKVREIKGKYGRFVLFVGRLSYYKGVEYLIRSMVGVKANLVIVGEGRLRRKMEEVARNLNLDKKVFFVGKVSAADLKAYLHACEVFCLPSIYNSEAFGLVQLEAMACAKPIVNTDLPTGVTLISKDGESGLTVPPKDVSALTLALNTLMVNEGERIKFGAKALERVKHLFSLNKMLNDIFALYNSLV